MQLSHDEKVTYFAETDTRNKRTKFGIKAKDRTRHMYVIGKTGMGKSTLLENMAVQDIKNGEGIAFIDPHGKTADLLLEYVPEERKKDVIYFAPFDMEYPISFNVLESVDPDKRHLVVSGLVSTFKKIWVDAWSARMEYILTNTLLALLEYPEATLLGVNRMLSDKAFRNKVVAHITDPSVKSFWVDEFANYTERMAAEAVPAIQNKIGQFTANPLIRNMIGQPKSSFNIREIMDSRKIMIVNLSKGRVGETNANLLGGMMITKIYLAAMSRADVSDRALKVLPNFYLFVDEFQNFANESFADILSEARKYKLNLTIAHQYIEQMEDEVRAAVFGNVGTMIVFRVGAYDAEVLEKEIAPTFTMEDIVNLGFAQIYLKLMIDGVSSQPFSAKTLGPIPQPEKSIVPEVIAESRAQFAQERAIVEAAVNEWMQPINPKVAKAKTATVGAVGAVGATVVPSVSTTTLPSTASAVPAPAVSAVAPPKGFVAPQATVQPQQPRPFTPTPRPAPTSTEQRPPMPMQQPPVHKPFANAGLGDLLKKVVSEPVVKAPAPSPVPPPPTNPAPVIKPISLSSLAPKVNPTNQGSTTTPGQTTSVPRTNPKSQSPQNIENLKAALAAAMKVTGNTAAPVPPTATPVATQATPPIQQPAPQQEPKKENPAEVPRDVLEKVLKID